MLAVIMLVILVAAVGAGWWLAASRRQYPKVALDVLADIRKRGLRAIWGDEPVTNWYIERRANGEPIGWRLEARVRLEDGRYASTNVKRLGAKEYVESWILDDTACTGQYEAMEYTLALRQGQTSPMRRPDAKTTITLNNAQVRIRRGIGRQTLTGAGPAPGNYIPEGLTDLVMFETATRGQKTSFQILLNSQAIQGRKPRFATITADPEGKQVIRTSIGKAGEIITFDKAGQVLRTTAPDSGRWSEKSTAELVAKIDPDAKRFAQLAPTTAPTTEPATAPALDDKSANTTPPTETQPEKSQYDGQQLP